MAVTLLSQPHGTARRCRRAVREEEQVMLVAGLPVLVGLFLVAVERFGARRVRAARPRRRRAGPAGIREYRPHGATPGGGRGLPSGECRQALAWGWDLRP